MNEMKLRILILTNRLIVFYRYSSANRAGVFNEAAVGALPAFLTMLPKDMFNDSASAEILISKPALMQTFLPDHAA
jgi:hypothetical protein